MINTVNTDVVTYLQLIGCGNFGTDLFFGRVPQSQKVPTELWWVIPLNSTILQHNASGEDVIRYTYDLNYRSLNLQKVNEQLFKASQEIVGSHCYELDNFHTINVELVSVNQNTMQDSENRIIGSITFTVTVYNILDTKQDESSDSKS